MFLYIHKKILSMYNLCQLTQLNLSCFGCCGHTFKSKKKIEQDLKKNTLEYEYTKDNITFRERAKQSDLRSSGICKNLILIDNIVVCPLHPELNDMMDLRIAHCDTDHICRTIREFNKWGRKKQQKFIDFLKSKRLDIYSYSKRIDSGALLREFKQKHL